MNTYEIINLLDYDIEELQILDEVINYTLKSEKVNDAILNVIIVDNKRIREINKKFRNIDRETDVISFAFEDNQNIELPVRMLGEIYISIDKAKEQAINYGHSLIREIAFLTVHGLLHLLGYDHMNKEDENIMFSRQEMILNELQITR